MDDDFQYPKMPPPEDPGRDAPEEPAEPDPAGRREGEDYYHPQDGPKPARPGGPAWRQDPPYYGPVPTSGLAIASLVTAFLCQPVGFILGIIALVKINRSQGRLGGLGFAIAGTVISACSTFICMPMVAAVAIPGLLRSRVGANQTSAIGSLKTICVGQEQFRSQCLVDQDGDGIGEYGFLSELAGTVPCRQSGEKVSRAPYIPMIFGSLTSGGVATKRGYCFKVYLPGRDGGALEEDGTPPIGDSAAADAQEEGYVVYAWPVSSKSGSCTFAMDHTGQIYRLDGSPWKGPGNPPPYDAALTDGDGDGRGVIGADSLGKRGWRSGY